MTEIELAKEIIDEAEKYYKEGITPFPGIIENKDYLSKFNLEILKKELLKHDYVMIDKSNANTEIEIMYCNSLQNSYFIHKK